MQAWLTNGCQLAWLIDPKAETVWIYRPNTPVETIVGFSQTLSGESVLEGFEFELAELRE
ncbi:MAG: Uma2 family endonuclease [Bacteroidia bacterium]